MSECDSLESKLDSILAKLQELDGKYIPTSERGKIVEEGGNKGKALALAAILPMLGMFANKDDMIARFNKAYGKATTAEDLAELARREVTSLESLAREAREEAAKAMSGARRAQSTADTAIDETKGLRRLWNQLDNKVNQVSSKIDDVFARLSGRIGDVARTAAKALGISDEALRIGRQALKTATAVLGKVLIILDLIQTILSVLNAIDLRRRMSQIENRVSMLESAFSRLLGQLFSQLEKIRATALDAKSTAEAAEALANVARTTAGNAQRMAGEARSEASGAFSLARQAFNIAVSYGAQVAIIGGLAAVANTKADAALRRTMTPGPAGRNGVDGKPGARGKDGLRGLPGKDGRKGDRGIPGIPGRNGLPGQPGRNGANGTNGAPGRPGRDGLPGAKGKDGINGKDGIVEPMDTALLRQIHAQTKRNGASAQRIQSVQVTHVSTSRNTNGIVKNVETISKKLQELSKKTWDFLQIEKVLLVMTYVTSLHNAYFLSRDIGDTLFWMINNVTQFIGIKDADGGAIDAGSIVNQWASDLAKTVIGEQNLANMKETWIKHNRIYQASANVLYSVRSIVDSANQAIETTGNYVAKIGNSLRRFGAVRESAYDFMNENFRTSRTNRPLWEKAMTGLENTENVTNDLASISSDVLDVKTQLDELDAQRDELDASVRDNGGFLNLSTPTEIENEMAEEKELSEAPISLEESDPYTVGVE